MKTKLSSLQLMGVIICIFIIIIGVVFGIFTKSSFLNLTDDENSILNAQLLIDEEMASELDKAYISRSIEEVMDNLKSYGYVFRVKCTHSELCYNCIKHTVTVMDTIKGDINENGNEIVIYQMGSFDKFNDGLAFNTYDFTMPLKAGKEYLVFAEKRDYYADYQNTLKSNEYSLGLKGFAHTAYILDDTQNVCADISHDKTYSDIKDLYYICFSQEALDSINDISDQVVSYYTSL